MEELQKYKVYLDFIDEKLKNFFAEQKPFIFCKKGCARCCQKAEFPYSELEMKYLLAGFLLLPAETKAIIEGNIRSLLEKKKASADEKFLYDCPFLIDNSCSVYNFRGVICRAFGLMTQIYGTNKIKAPFCNELGLNYSNVINKKTQKVSVAKYKKLKCKEEPNAYNTSYRFLTCDAFEEDFGIKFGDKKPLINWFLEEPLKQNADEVCKQTDL